MSNEIAKVFEMTEERFKKVAPPAISYEAERGFAMQLLTNNSYLMKAAQENQASLAQAITNVAAIGLSLNPAEKQAYLIPRNVKEGNLWKTKVFLEPSYTGLIKLATDSGSIEWAQADCVYANDEFIDNGVGEKPTHKYNAFSKDRGDFVGVYCVAKTHTGDYLTNIMDANAISSVMERSESVKKYRQNNNSGHGGPWISDFKEMAKKTVIRNAFKTWPRTNERAAAAVNISNENEGFDPLLTSPQTIDFTVEQKKYYDQLIEKSDALEMYVLLTNVEETVRNNLYHSFEKGTKGKYQQIVDNLYKTGFSIFQDCIDSMNQGAEANDDMAVMEVYESVSNDCYFLMVERGLSEEARTIIKENE